MQKTLIHLFLFLLLFISLMLLGSRNGEKTPPILMYLHYTKEHATDSDVSAGVASGLVLKRRH